MSGEYSRMLERLTRDTSFCQAAIYAGMTQVNTKESPDASPGFLRMHLYHSREMRLGLRDVSRVRRSIIQEYSPGIGSSILLCVVILYHIPGCESERFVKNA